MFEVATTETHRQAIERAHSERAAVFAAGMNWIKAHLHLPHFGAAAASGH